MSANLRVIEGSNHHGRDERRLVDVFVKGGLVDAKHCDAFPTPLMLYLYLLQRADFETGTVGHYRHEQAVKQLGKPRRTIERWYEHLKDHGYITDRRHRTNLEIAITRYLPQSARKRTKQTHQDPPHLSQRSARSGGSLYRSNASSNLGTTTDVVEAPAKPKPAKKTQAVPKPDRLGAVIDGIRLAGLTVTGSARDGKALKDNPDVPAALVVEAFVAAARDEWGSDWLRANPKIWAVVEDVPGYVKWKQRGGTHGQSTNGAHATGGRSGGRGATLPPTERDRIRAARTGGSGVP